jgi:ribonucrease Y
MQPDMMPHTTMEGIVGVIAAVLGLILGALIGWFGLTYYQNSQGKNRKALAETEAQSITDKAKAEALTKLREADEQVKKVTDEANEQAIRRRRELDKEDERLQRKREDLDNCRKNG